MYGIYVWTKYVSIYLRFSYWLSSFPKHIQHCIVSCLLCIVCEGEPCGESLVTELRDAVMSYWIYLDRSLREAQ